MGDVPGGTSQHGRLVGPSPLPSPQQVPPSAGLASPASAARGSLWNVSAQRAAEVVRRPVVLDAMLNGRRVDVHAADRILDAGAGGSAGVVHVGLFMALKDRCTRLRRSACDCRSVGLAASSPTPP